MKIVKAWPPNIEEIQLLLPGVHDEVIFCWGETIFNPSGKELSPDLIHHESIHSRQQGDDPHGWWYTYLRDPAFRLSQELEAYGEQFLLAKEAIDEADAKAASEGKRLEAGRAKLIAFALEGMAMALSGSEYGNLISYGEAESKIRNYRKAA